MNISSTLISCDKTCDYIPVVSFFTNLSILFRKYCKTTDSVNSNPISFDRHIENKPTKRCLALLVPFVGNFWIYREDAKKAALKKEAFTSCFACTGHLPNQIAKLKKERADSGDWSETLNPLLEHEQFIRQALPEIGPDSNLEGIWQHVLSLKKNLLQTWEEAFTKESTKKEQAEKASLVQYENDLADASLAYQKSPCDKTWTAILPDLLSKRAGLFSEAASSAPYLMFYKKCLLGQEGLLLEERKKTFLASITDSSSEKKLSSLFTPFILGKFPSLSLLTKDELLLKFIQTSFPNSSLSLEDITLETKVAFLERTTECLQGHHPLELVEVQGVLSLLASGKKDKSV